MFPPALLHFIITTALIWTALGALALLLLLCKDWAKGTLW